MKDKKKFKDWEYMLKSAIYLSLIGYNDSNGYTIPCKTRGEIEDAILDKFKKSLSKDNYTEPQASQSGQDREGTNDDLGFDLSALMVWLHEDPYPEDLFPPVSPEILKQIHETLKLYYRMPLDRLSAQIGRTLRKGLIESVGNVLAQHEAQTSAGTMEGELVKLQEEYIKFLETESGKADSFLMAHHWEYPKEIIGKGRELRNLITKAKSLLSKTI